MKNEDEGLYPVQHGYWLKTRTRLQWPPDYGPPEEVPMTARDDYQRISQQAIEQFLYREARYLDDREFEKWLACYADDVEYWMPSWRRRRPALRTRRREISLIYYHNRGGLEDRVFRIKTDRSSATTLPEPRTSHNISNVEVVEPR